MISKKRYIALCAVVVVLIFIMLNLVNIDIFFNQLSVSCHSGYEVDYDITLNELSDNLSNGLASDSLDTSTLVQASDNYDDSIRKDQEELIIIEGVEFPIRSSFLAPKSTGSDWGGSFSSWSELEHTLDHKIIASTDLILSSDKIEFTHAVAGSDGVILSKTKNGYNISISVKLSGSVLAEQNAAVVKAMVATISSEPTIVFDAIFDSFTSGKTHGITKKKYKKIGDCRIKLRIKDGVVSYLIKK